MHVEMSLESQPEKQDVDDEKVVESSDKQTIDGSQVVAAFANMDYKPGNIQASGFRTMAISMAAIMSVAALYLVFVLVL